ncbi:hypothetical protein UU5_13938 [Rhodanobacter sp. 115]|jgi:hypothetical protein|nr:hypothetical protein UU5_13938 [Rhodanobacter sp. 115]
MASALRSEEGARRADEGWVLAEMMIEACFDHGHSQEWPLTPALSSLLKAGAIHGASPRTPKGRGIKATATQ